MWLCGVCYGVFRVGSCHALCPRVLLVLFSIVFTSLGKRELDYVLLVHLFVYIACIIFHSFSLPLCVRDWLRLVIVALLGLFY